MVLAEELRRASSSSIRPANLSHGRGGAGNIGASPYDTGPVSLNTPTLKGDVYTTGRGGSGNMTKNTDPESARRAQDVVVNPRRESISPSHVGRGGAANVFKPTEAEIATARKDAKWDSAISDEDELEYSTPDYIKPETEKGFADKGKAWLKDKIGKA
ncbi:hypothetical protein DSL72_003120 [Monilinia vaccinii-corymbosi]|uniref:Uncharacterized protein n=1 Tax=Monilinia vaccinii-corymbosi TaxID=61207 RepID=A0A8A3P1E9_9HELO|nr:hypothetical protein DSL72_003120 [Monilinia vaccinii-corymbosi]